jgi:hypothetical protein
MGRLGYGQHGERRLRAIFGGKPIAALSKVASASWSWASASSEPDVFQTMRDLIRRFGSAVGDSFDPGNSEETPALRRSDPLILHYLSA